MIVLSIAGSMRAIATFFVAGISPDGMGPQKNTLRNAF
jgi:hypothetical protein